MEEVLKLRVPPTVKSPATMVLPRKVSPRTRRTSETCRLKLDKLFKIFRSVRVAEAVARGLNRARSAEGVASAEEVASKESKTMVLVLASRVATLSSNEAILAHRSAWEDVAPLGLTGVSVWKISVATKDSTVSFGSTKLPSVSKLNLLTFSFNSWMDLVNKGTIPMVLSCLNPSESVDTNLGIIVSTS